MSKPAAKPAAKNVEAIAVETRKTMEDGVEKMTKGIENAAAFGQEKVEKIAVEARKTMAEGVEKVTKDIENTAAFGQENVEAAVRSSKIATEVAESMGAEIAAYSKKAYQDGMTAARELTACKSVAEFVEKQTEFGKSSIESFVAEAARLNEMYAAAAKEAFAPLNARFTAAAGIVKDTRV